MAVWWTVTCDARDPHALAAFWAAALGYVPEPGYDEPDAASIVDPDGRGPAISFQRVPEPKTAKNRLHLDVRPAVRSLDPAERTRLIRAKADELVALGASEVREQRYGDELGHVVLRDPEGHEFCVA